ncbi:MAG: phage tail protein [Vulcanisaeta sp. MG_3]|jgi:Predicted signal-transduction protein containing cAMP-binding and CBS domains|nr:MAG: phage tail protein [Vulcanisaeta sp. MG_3]
MSITVDKIIKRKPLVINQNARVKDAVEIMAKENVGLLVIVNDAGKPIGVISERDVVRALASGKDLNARVTEAGTVGKLVTVNPGDSIYKAALLMNDNKIRHLIVMDGEKLRGVISIRDIISEERVVSRLAELAEAKPEVDVSGGAD